jgi:hypothetical protein
VNPAKLIAPMRESALERLEPVVEALLCDLVVDEFHGHAYLPQTRDRLLHKIRQMPPHLGLGMVGLTLAWDAYGVGRGGKPSHLQPVDQRKQRFHEWREGPVLLQTWTQFYEKMGVFVYWSTVEDNGAEP